MLHPSPLCFPFEPCIEDQSYHNPNEPEYPDN